MGDIKKWKSLREHFQLRVSTHSAPAARTADLLLYTVDHGGDGGWVGYGCVRVGVPNRLRGGPRCSKDKMIRLG